MEKKLRDAMVLSDGEWQYLFSSGISTGLIIASIIGFCAPIFLRRILAKPKAVSD
jgi:putative tricarboxylic transport membrane protein